MPRYNWEPLNRQQIGAYAEYFVKMELTMHGFEVYSSEVDDRGVDFVARLDPGSFIAIQVKSLRGSGYVFMHKRKFNPLDEYLYLALALFFEGKPPELYLVPSSVWGAPKGIFVSRDYKGEDQTSEPEWGLNISRKNMPELEPFRFANRVEKLKTNAKPTD